MQRKHLLVVIAILFITIVCNSTSAFALTDDSNRSTRDARNSYNGRDNQGAIWANTFRTWRDGNMESDVAEAESNAATIKVWLHGAFIGGNGFGDGTCNGSSEAYATNLAIQNGDGFISLDNPGTTIFRGYCGGTGKWSTGWDAETNVSATLNVADFKKEAEEAEKKAEAKDKNKYHRFEGDYEIWEKDIDLYRCWYSKQYGTWTTGYCGPSPVTIRLKSEATHEVVHEGNITSDAYAKVGNSQESHNTSNPSVHYINSPNDNNINAAYSFRNIINNGVDVEIMPAWSINRKTDNDRYNKIASGTIKIKSNDSAQVSTSSTTKNTSSKVSLGTKKQYCQSTSHPTHFKIVYTVRNSDNTIIRSTPPEYTGWTDNYSQACAEARHPYDFTTSASIEDLPATYDLGSTIDIKGSVKNASTHDNNKSTPQTITPADTKYRLLYFTVNPNTAFGAVKIEGISGYTKDDPCLHFKDNSKGVTCHSKLSENEGSVDPGKEISLSGKVTIGDEVELGTKYCFATAINYTHSGSGYNGGLNKTWTISNATCTGVAKKPHFQVWGGVYSPSSITASQIKKGNTTYGSWAEHLVVAKGKITSFASGASLGYDGYGFSGNAGSTASSAKLNPLTISNNNPNNLGFSKIDASTGIVDVLKDRFANKTEATKIGIDYRDSVSNIGLTARANGTAVYVGNNITISDNICYSKDANTCKNSSSTTLSSYNDVTISNLNNMPQILIFAKNITIKPDVTRIDAWLISDGTINTCVENSDQCSKTLVINGPVFANELKLNRTAGASGGAVNGVNDVLNRDLATDGYAAPAEIFNLRGDAYLWSYLQAQRTNEAVTSYIRELAPRL